MSKQTRHVYTVSEAIAHVGGLQAIFVLIFAILFKPLDSFNNEIDIINKMFTFYSKEQFVWTYKDPDSEENCHKIQLSYCDRLRIFFGICPNK